MKNRIVNEDFVFRKWDVEKCGFPQIAEMDIPSTASLKAIENIVYGGLRKCKSDFRRKVYLRFRLKFLELQDVRQAILWVYDNQPTVRISERSVKRIINDCLKKNREKAL